jgi:predicted ribosomally synthesized six-cysteine peptide SCIFF
MIKNIYEEIHIMKHIKTIAAGTLKKTEGKGCGECQTSCQSACKTSCTVANQECENIKIKRR